GGHPAGDARARQPQATGAVRRLARRYRAERLSPLVASLGGSKLLARQPAGWTARVPASRRTRARPGMGSRTTRARRAPTTGRAEPADWPTQDGRALLPDGT